MMQVVPLKPNTMNTIATISGESIAELEVKYMNACDRNQVVLYTIQVWSERKPISEHDLPL